MRRSAGTIILKLAYGYTAQEEADPMVILVEKAMETMTPATSPGVWLVDTLPFLRFLPTWFPGAGFKKIAAEMGKLVQDMADVPYEHLKKQLVRFLSISSRIALISLMGFTRLMAKAFRLTLLPIALRSRIQTQRQSTILNGLLPRYILVRASVNITLPSCTIAYDFDFNRRIGYGK